MTADLQPVPGAGPDEASLREGLAEAMRELDRLGLNRGTVGNASCRFGEHLLVTPSGVPADDLAPDGIVLVERSGRARTGRPSTEWRLHRAILDRRPDLGAVVHTHSHFATVLACARRPLRPVHYLLGLTGSHEVPVADYATFGSAELAEATVTALGDGRACLMAHHGVIAAGPTLAAAVELAGVVEEQAQIDWRCLAIGGDATLEASEMQRVIAGLDHYRGSEDSS